MFTKNTEAQKIQRHKNYTDFVSPPAPWPLSLTYRGRVFQLERPLSRFSTSEYFRAKRLFSFAKIFASGKPALRNVYVIDIIR